MHGGQGALQMRGAVTTRITFNVFRHPCVSLLFQKNVHPKLVQVLLGHVGS